MFQTCEDQKYGVTEKSRLQVPTIVVKPDLAGPSRPLMADDGENGSPGGEKGSPCGTYGSPGSENGSVAVKTCLLRRERVARSVRAVEGCAA